MGEVQANKFTQSADLKGSSGQRNWMGWLKEATFYIHGLVYMMVRIAVNTTMTMLPFYLVEVT